MSCRLLEFHAELSSLDLVTETVGKDGVKPRNAVDWREVDKAGLAPVALVATLEFLNIGA